jgi:redox-sensitive bicupin YhaK (pirin superfamily)
MSLGLAINTVIGRDADLGDGTTVTRLLPRRRRRSIGAWCFADDYGSLSVGDGPGMRVGPHPHIGLQTVTFLVAGEVLHRDGLGNAVVVRPGDLALMTAGSGIVHAEESVPGTGPILQGVQLWIALPDDRRWTEPIFSHHGELPEVELGGFVGRVLIGTLASATSPAAVHSPLVAAEIRSRSSATATVPLESDYEHGMWSLSGSVRVNGTLLERGTLAYIAPGATELLIDSAEPSRVFLVGGRPLEEELLLWWNFVARTSEEVSAARSRWEAGEFAPVVGYDGPPIPAPPLPQGRLTARL